MYGVRQGECEGRIDSDPLHISALASDWGAALARIMQADNQALEAWVSEPTRPKEFVIEMTGDHDTIRVIRDQASPRRCAPGKLKLEL